MPERRDRRWLGWGAVRGVMALLAAGPIVAAAPRPAAPVVIDCYVVQSDGNGAGSFVRHLEIDRERGVVSIADSLGGTGLRFVGNGRLVALDADRVVYDFASRLSGGRTEIDRRSGAFVYNDGRSVIRGSCQTAGS